MVRTSTFYTTEVQFTVVDGFKKTIGRRSFYTTEVQFTVASILSATSSARTFLYH